MMAGTTLDPYVLHALQDLNTGESPSSLVIPAHLMLLRLGLSSSLTEYARTASFLDLLEIYEARSVASAEDAPVPKDALFESARFLQDLPTDVPAPEVDATPTGEVVFTWQVDRDHSYLITLSGDGTFHYAGLFGLKTRTRGREGFARQIPARVLSDLKRLHGSGV